MNVHTKPSPQEIRRARAENPKMRERDLSAQLGISEAELAAAHIGEGVTRLEPRVNVFLSGLEAVGEVMALTRNESAVHEKIGVYDKVVNGENSIMLLSSEIDLRVFPKVWAHGFAVEKRDGDDIRRSFQFFDTAGDAVHKVHLRPKSDLDAYQKLVAELVSDNQEPGLSTEPAAPEPAETSEASVEDLRDRWSKMTDVHQFFGMLRSLKLSRRQAMRMIGEDYAWPVDLGAVSTMFGRAVESETPIMCFVGNRGCIQIHSGPIRNVKEMGPWLNVLDETFHLHLRQDHISEAWVVRKPSKDGHVTSLEAYDAEGKMIIQFFGKRKEGYRERDDWRLLAEKLPRVPQSTAA